MYDIIVIGGGLSGTLAALQYSSLHPDKKVALFEKRNQLLPGMNSRANLQFRERYWTRKQLFNLLADTRIEVFRSSGVVSINLPEKTDNIPPVIQVKTRRAVYKTGQVILACGQDPEFLEVLSKLGLNTRPFKPAAFQLRCDDPRLRGVKENKLNVALSWVRSGGPRKRIQIQLASALPETQILKQIEGSVNLQSGILSGAAVNQLSRYIAEQNETLPEHIKICINWMPDYGFQGILEYMQLVAQAEAHKTIVRTRLFSLPSILWTRLVTAADIAQGDQWKDLLPEQFQELATQIADSQFTMKPDLRIASISMYQGGVHPDNLYSDRPECKKHPGIFLIGSILDKEEHGETADLPVFSDNDFSWIRNMA